MRSNSNKLVFGANKYTAFNLMVARWLAEGGSQLSDLVYVTMGGTELYDVTNICWVRDNLIKSIVSFEQDENRFKLALDAASRLNVRGLNVEARNEDYFGYSRVSDQPHGFFIDLTGSFHQSFTALMRTWFSSDVVRPGDFLFVTSYQGRNIGWPKLLESFYGEFAFLGISDVELQKAFYRAAHPAFVVYSALEKAGLTAEFRINSLGAVKYHDTSPMGIYGFTLDDGSTDLRTLVNGTRMFDAVSRDWHSVWIDS